MGEMGVKKARNPKWANTIKDALYMELLIGEEWTPYCAAPSTNPSCDALSSALYNFAMQGLFGEIEASDEEKIIKGELPVPEGCVIRNGEILSIAEQEQVISNELNRRLAEFNSEESKARAEIDLKYAQERKKRLEHLLEIKKQKGYPFEVKWE